MAGPSPDGLFYLLDDSPNSFALTPGFLTPYPNGLFALGGNDFIVGSSDAEILSGDNGHDRILGGGNRTFGRTSQGEWRDRNGSREQALLPPRARCAR